VSSKVCDRWQQSNLMHVNIVRAARWKLMYVWVLADWPADAWPLKESWCELAADQVPHVITVQRNKSGKARHI